MNDFTKGIRGFFHAVDEFSMEFINFVDSFRFCFGKMRKSKKVFLLIAIVFVLATLIVGYDISRKTSFPGSKKLLKESIAPTEEVDSTTVNKIGENISEQ